MSIANVGMYFMTMAVWKETNIIQGLISGIVRCLEVCVSVDN